MGNIMSSPDIPLCQFKEPRQKFSPPNRIFITSRDSVNADCGASNRRRRRRRRRPPPPPSPRPSDTSSDCGGRGKTLAEQISPDMGNCNW